MPADPLAAHPHSVMEWAPDCPACPDEYPEESSLTKLDHGQLVELPEELYGANVPEPDPEEDA
jgi:hypothetical protein